jgi:hypothetical protein
MTMGSTYYTINFIENNFLHIRPDFFASHTKDGPIACNQINSTFFKIDSNYEITSFFCFSSISTCKLEMMTGYLEAVYIKNVIALYNRKQSHKTVQSS